MICKFNTCCRFIFTKKNLKYIPIFIILKANFFPVLALEFSSVYF